MVLVGDLTVTLLKVSHVLWDTSDILGRFIRRYLSLAGVHRSLHTLITLAL